MNLNYTNTKKYALILLFTFFVSIISYAQEVTVDSLAIQYSESITQKGLKEHLEILASDEYEGRETGEKGQYMAAEYIANYFSSLTISPAIGDTSYFQQVPMERIYPDNVRMTWNESSFTFGDDFYYFRGFSDKKLKGEEIVFAGYGIEEDHYNDYDGIDVEGKVILILDDEPVDKSGNSIITGTEEPSGWIMNWRTKLMHAKSKGAVAVLVIDTEFDNNLEQMESRISNPSIMLASADQKDRILPNFYISEQFANQLLGTAKKDVQKLTKKITKKKKPQSFEIKGDFILEMNRKREPFLSENVIGVIEGSEHPDEYIVLSGHYDHLGIRGEDIYNGADDNGSGTVSVMMMANAFAQAVENGHQPKRSVVFALWTGEEKGLLGSTYYSDNPVYPLEQTVSNLNIDMIGRVDDIYAEKENQNYMYLIGANRLSSELHEISVQANSLYTNLTLDFTYNDPEDPNRLYYRSDHYNFAKHGIPSIFYFNGMHEDYHKPTDTFEKIDFELMKLRSQLVFFTAWELLNRKDRIVVDVELEVE